MYHAIQFNVPFVTDLEISRKHRLERIAIRQGDQRQAQIKPYVVESIEGPVEVADLFLDDGTTIRGVPFACFAFLE